MRRKSKVNRYAFDIVSLHFVYFVMFHLLIQLFEHILSHICFRKPYDFVAIDNLDIFILCDLRNRVVHVEAAVMAAADVELLQRPRGVLISLQDVSHLGGLGERALRGRGLAVGVHVGSRLVWEEV